MMTTEIEDDITTTEIEDDITATEMVDDITTTMDHGTTKRMIETFYIFIIVGVVALSLLICCVFYVIYRILYGRSHKSYDKVNTSQAVNDHSNCTCDREEVEVTVIDV